MTDKLVEKCLLTEEKLQSDEFDGLKFDSDDIQYVLEAQLIHAIPIIAEELFEEIKQTGVLRGHRYILEGNMRQDEEHYPDRCGLCQYELLKTKYLGTHSGKDIKEVNDGS